MTYHLDLAKRNIKLVGLSLLVLFLLCGCSLFKKDTPGFDCKVFLPVCGDDEVTYYNQCQAQDYKVDIAYEGACNGTLVKTIPYEVESP